jgi:hypothetical protein
VIQLVVVYKTIADDVIAIVVDASVIIVEVIIEVVEVVVTADVLMNETSDVVEAVDVIVVDGTESIEIAGSVLVKDLDMTSAVVAEVVELNVVVSNIVELVDVLCLDPLAFVDDDILYPLGVNVLILDLVNGVVDIFEFLRE